MIMVIFQFKPDVRGLNLKINAAASEKFDINEFLDLRALDSFISHGYIAKKP